MSFTKRSTICKGHYRSWNFVVCMGELLQMAAAIMRLPYFVVKNTVISQANSTKGEFKKIARSISLQRFWATDGNRNSAVFLLNLSSHYHIDIFKSLSTVLACEMFTFGCRPWNRCVLQLPNSSRVYICYLPAGRSVLGKTVPEVLSTARDRTQYRGHSFSQYGPTWAGK